MPRSVYIETMGCQMNVADTERVSSHLRHGGYEIAQSPEAADIVLLNSCSVRERASQKVFNRIGEIRKARLGNQPLFGVMGCVAQLEGESLIENGSPIQIVLGTRATDRVVSALDEVHGAAERVVDLGERRQGEKWEVPAAERHSPYVAFIPIIEGCNKFCTYCIVPFSRGREVSRPPGEILDEVRRLKELGFKEIHLIGQNVNSYRPGMLRELEDFPGATPFTRLLRAVAATGSERIKFTTSFPRDFHRDIVSAIDENSNLCDWVHLPVQSGSNRILKLMRRGHTVENYLERIAAIKAANRRIALTTDLIVGFPGETERDFDDTLELVEKCQYDSLYVFKYSPRPGTPAESLTDDVPDIEKTRRLMKVVEVQKKHQKLIYNSYIGKELSVLVESTSSKSELDLSGHSTCNKVVNFPGDRSLIGRVVPVRITEAKENSLYGRLAAGKSS